MNTAITEWDLVQTKKFAYDEGFIDGAKYAIEYLIDLFDGIENTDIYKDYFPKSKENI